MHQVMRCQYIPRKYSNKIIITISNATKMKIWKMTKKKKNKLMFENDMFNFKEFYLTQTYFDWIVF